VDVAGAGETGKDDDGLAKPIELFPNEGDGLVGHTVVIEKIAGDQQQIDLIAEGAIDDTLEEPTAAAWAACWATSP